MIRFILSSKCFNFLSQSEDMQVTQTILFSSTEITFRHLFLEPKVLLMCFQMYCFIIISNIKNKF